MFASRKGLDQLDQFLFLIVRGEVVGASSVVLGTSCSPHKVVASSVAIIGGGEVDPIPIRESNEPRNIVVILGENNLAVRESLDERRAISEENSGNVLVAVLSVSSVAHLRSFV